MIHIKRLLLSFGSAWVASILGLLVAGRFQEPVENFHSADPFGDSIRWGLLYVYFTLMCVGAAWVLVATPYYFVFLRNCGRWPLILHSLVAGVSGFLFMMLATQMLPVDDKSWRFTSPIAFAVGFFGALMARYDLFLPKTKPAEHVVGGNGG
jgi:hypothetical protein